MQTKKQKYATRRNWCKKVISGAAYSLQALVYQNVYSRRLSTKELRLIITIKNQLKELLSVWKKG